MSSAIFCDEQILAKYIVKYVMCIYMSISARKKASSLIQIKKKKLNWEISDWQFHEKMQMWFAWCIVNSWDIQLFDQAFKTDFLLSF